MSRENVEMARALHDAFNRGDTDVINRLHADLEWEEDTAAFPGIEPLYRGPQGFAEWSRFISESWEEFRATPSELIDAGDDVVIATEVEARGAGSGMDVNMRVHQVWTFREGKLTRRRYFLNRDDDLEAAGLRE
jgi:ketosteroid isomerase-like protein